MEDSRKATDREKDVSRIEQLLDQDRRAHVAKYPNTASFPFEVGETVYIVKPELRAPLGEFRISKAHEADKFELVRVSDGSTHPELVDGIYLCRDPYTVAS